MTKFRGVILPVLKSVIFYVSFNGSGSLVRRVNVLLSAMLNISEMHGQ